jgi:hypothetical protein
MGIEVLPSSIRLGRKIAGWISFFLPDQDGLLQENQKKNEKMHVEEFMLEFPSQANKSIILANVIHTRTKIWIC